MALATPAISPPVEANVVVSTDATLGRGWRARNPVRLDLQQVCGAHVAPEQLLVFNILARQLVNLDKGGQQQVGRL